jgi:hypothetical protein
MINNRWRLSLGNHGRPNGPALRPARTNRFLCRERADAKVRPYMTRIPESTRVGEGLSALPAFKFKTIPYGRALAPSRLNRGNQTSHPLFSSFLSNDNPIMIKPAFVNYKFPFGYRNWKCDLILPERSSRVG